MKVKVHINKQKVITEGSHSGMETIEKNVRQVKWTGRGKTPKAQFEEQLKRSKALVKVRLTGGRSIKKEVKILSRY